MIQLRPRFFWPLCFLLSFAACAAQSNPACSIPPPQFTSTSPNIFDEKQEQILGDVLAEMKDSNLTLLPPSSPDEITRIGQKLLATLPPTNTHYQFRVYDSGEVNAFSTTGGRVYVSRKLLTAVHNEDELAGVLAHEIGHLITHQIAIEMTSAFRLRLGITQVGDRADIVEKANRFFSTPPSHKEDSDENNGAKDELAADQVSIYAMLRAGYQPQSYVTFLDSITQNKGKTGSRLSDLFGFTSEDSQRYHAGLKMIAGLPAECRQPAQPTEAFRAWQKGIIDAGTHIRANSVEGEHALALESPLRPVLWRIRFSPDGRYVLAQDESSITIMDRQDNKVLFQIDAPDAEGAQFTPDSHAIVFNNAKLRIETWDIATGKLSHVKEMVVYDGCSQTQLSPDGQTLACIQMRGTDESSRADLKIFDVSNGTILWEKQGFAHPPDLSDYFIWYAFTYRATSLFSQDGRYLLIKILDQVMAFDLQTRQPLELSGALKNLIAHASNLAFVGPEELLVGTGDYDKKNIPKARIYNLPDSHLLRETLTSPGLVGTVTKGHLMIVYGMKDNALGILDYEQGKFLGTTKSNAMDIWTDIVAAENGAGSLNIQKLNEATSSTSFHLPLGQLPPLQSVRFSEDGRYLAISLKSRGEIWDLQTGKSLSVTRPFRQAWLDANSQMFVQFPQYQDRDPKTMKLTLDPFTTNDLHKYENEDTQYRDMELRFHADGKDKSINTHATLQVKKMESQALLWSAAYPHETPSVWGTQDGRLVLAWDIANQTAKDEIKKHPVLQAQIAAFKNPKLGILIETVEPATGQPLQQAVIPETDLSHGWNEVDRALVSGDCVLLQGNHNDTVIYSLKDGSKIGSFFGFPLTTDAASGVIAASNRDDEVMLLDAHNGKELQRFTFGTSVRGARIIDGKDKRLLVLTADQVVHSITLQ